MLYSILPSRFLGVASGHLGYIWGSFHFHFLEFSLKLFRGPESHEVCVVSLICVCSLASSNNNLSSSDSLFKQRFLRTEHPAYSVTVSFKPFPTLVWCLMNFLEIERQLSSQLKSLFMSRKKCYVSCRKVRKCSEWMLMGHHR